MKKSAAWSLEINSSLKKCYGLIENPENHPKWSPYKIHVKKIDKNLTRYKWELDIDLPIFGIVSGYCETIIQTPYNRYKFKGVMNNDDVEATIIEDYQLEEISPVTIKVVRISTLELPNINGFIVENLVGSQFNNISNEVKSNLRTLLS